jgi:hypothetical protein
MCDDHPSPADDTPGAGGSVAGPAARNPGFVASTCACFHLGHPALLCSSADWPLAYMGGLCVNVSPIIMIVVVFVGMLPRPKVEAALLEQTELAVRAHD